MPRHIAIEFFSRGSGAVVARSSSRCRVCVALLELLLAQVVEVRVDVLVQDLIADAGVGGEGDCGEVDVD